LYAIYNLRNLLNISLLFLLICCTSEENNNTVTTKQDEKNINKEDLSPLTKIDSNHIEKRNAFLKDSLAEVKLEKMRLLAKKGLDSIYPIWEANKINELDILKKENQSINEFSWETFQLNKKINLIKLLIKIGRNRPKLHTSSITLEDEFKNLINQLDTSKNWSNNNLIHSILGAYFIHSPGIESVDYIEYNYEEVLSNSDRFGINKKILLNHIQEINNVNNSISLIPINTIYFGGGAEVIYINPAEIIGYRIITETGIKIDDSEINYLEQKGIIDTSSFKRIMAHDVNWSTLQSNSNWTDTISFLDTDWKNDEHYLKLALGINILSKTDPIKVALYLIQKDLGITNPDLLDCKGGIKIEINNIYNFDRTMFWRVNGKLYYAGEDQSDNIDWENYDDI
jgi:hypothetical protein